jgi:hypothetical protein
MNPQSAMARLEALPGWISGKIIARKALLEQATSDKERDQHHRLIGEYEKKAMAEDLTRRNGA